MALLTAEHGSKLNIRLLHCASVAHAGTAAELSKDCTQEGNQK
jgi:hypothetical protein